MNNRINHLAVWILVVLHQLVGFGWYAIFGELWLNYHARTMTDIERTHDVRAYLVAIVTAMVVNYALAWLIGRLEIGDAVGGMKVGIFCWFAFLFVEYSTISIFSAFETNPWPLVFINMGRPLVGFVASGLLLGAWQKRSSTVSGQ